MGTAAYDEKAPDTQWMTSITPGDDEKEYHQNDDNVVHDAVWGDLDGNGPNYRGLGWYVS
jgi:hypothetical protein